MNTPSTLKLTENEEPRAKKTVKTAIRRIKEVVTVEPLVACYQMALFLSRPALDNLEFEKACRVNLGINDTICNSILSGKHERFVSENNKVQTVISTMHSWQQPVQSFTPIILVLFLGSFSDRYKLRKPFLVLPIIGEFLGITGCILCTVFLYEFPLEMQGISQKIIPSLFGGQIMLAMASTAYIADVSSVEMRTLRLGIVQIVISVALPLVQSVSGIFFVKTGYKTVLSASLILNVIALGYGFWIKEPQKDDLKKSSKGLLVDIFDPKHARDTFKLLLTKKDNDRVLIWLIIFMAFMHKAAFDGESNVLYLYTQNVFEWTPLEYSYFLTVNSVVALAGHLFAVPLFTRFFHVGDLMILLITTLDKIVTNVIFGLANNVVIFYSGVAISIITRVYKTAKKSLATKIVTKNDFGKAQSLLGICDVVAPAIFVPVYNKVVYINSLQVYPALFFFFSIFLYSLCCLSIVIMYMRVGEDYIEKRQNNKNNDSTPEKNITDSTHL
ncbi:putative peptidoglycan muropeptide transporter SLC46 [Rhynchophorus ferrugineus]|uniref:putative peptidoglycan muropeptide transporter SLC46 n=1 Tax=Rhynchophorus ferrugineus TaxID=354439 RepID=UPI003FCDD666